MSLSLTSRPLPSVFFCAEVANATNNVSLHAPSGPWYQPIPADLYLHISSGSSAISSPSRPRGGLDNDRQDTPTFPAPSAVSGQPWQRHRSLATGSAGANIRPTLRRSMNHSSAKLLRYSLVAVWLATDQAAKLNNLARGSYSDFVPIDKAQ